MNRNQKIAMAEKGLSVKKLAFIIDLHPCYVSNLFSGSRKSKTALKKIAEVLGTTVDHLWPEHTNGQEQ